MWRKCWKIFLEAIFSIRENFFQSFRRTFSLSFYMILLAKKISFCLSVNNNPELRCVIYTGVTLFALVLHLNCTALSQSESSNFFMYIISSKIVLSLQMQIYITLLNWLKWTIPSLSKPEFVSSSWHLVEKFSAWFLSLFLVLLLSLDVTSSSKLSSSITEISPVNYYFSTIQVLQSVAK